MKRIIVCLMFIVFILSNAMSAFASQPLTKAIITTDGVCGVPLAPAYMQANTLPNRIEAQKTYDENLSAMVSASAFMDVGIHIPCDDEFRASHSNWVTVSKNAVENADDFYFNNYEINWNVRESSSWSSDTRNKDKDLLREAKSEAGLSGEDIMIAFTGQTGNSAGGWGDIGSPYSLVIDQSASANQTVARHEVGHNYGMEHCDDSCYMVEDASMYNNYDNICSFHANQMDDVRTEYGS